MVGSVKHMNNLMDYILDVQGHSGSFISVVIESAYAN